MSVVVKPIATETCIRSTPARSASTLLQFLRARARGTLAPGLPPQRTTVKALDATEASAASLSQPTTTTPVSNDSRYRVFSGSSRRFRL